MNTFGSILKVTLFGESHGPAIGAVVDGVPAGIRIDMDTIQKEMARRAPGQTAYTTQRKETDAPEILSGLKEGLTTGASVACIIRNTDTRPQDYPSAFRPGHADWPAYIKSGGFADLSGGGSYSGRLTAGLVFAGAIAKICLAEKGVEIYGRIKAIAGDADDIDLCVDLCWEDSLVREDLKRIAAKPFPAADDKEAKYLDYIALAKEDSDSVGGVVETICFGVPTGAGEPFFASVESRIAAMLFSIPAVKGVEFGKGFALTAIRGSVANDPLVLADGVIRASTNNNGGVLGGLANGMPIIVRAAIKPTSSVGLPQQTVDPATGAETILSLKGRHDPCIVPRAVPVVEAGTAVVLLDLLMEGGLF